MNFLKINFSLFQVALHNWKILVLFIARNKIFQNTATKPLHNHSTFLITICVLLLDSQFWSSNWLQRMFDLNIDCFWA